MIKVDELEKADLDAQVALAQRMQVGIMNDEMMPGFRRRYCVVGPSQERYSPSTDWSLGGPIIDAYRITIAAVGRTERSWFAEIDGIKLDTGVEVGGGKYTAEGPTALIAAMRALVRSQIGDPVPDAQ